MSTTADRIRECRTAAGLSQSELSDRLQNHDAYYLVETTHKQLLVRVGAHEMTSRELNEHVTANRFVIGDDSFRRLPELQRA